MPRRVDIQQRTPEWHKWREGKISSSMIGTIMGLNPKKSPLMLYNQIKDGKEEPVNAFMQKGIDLEPAARARAEKEYGCEYPEACFEHDEFPYFITSLDGYNPLAKYKALEAKCPQANAHQSAKLGVVPAYNYPQLQWDLYILEIDEIVYESYQSDNDVEFIITKRDEAFIEKAVEAAEDFRKCLVNYIEPDSLDMDLANVGDQQAYLLATELYMLQMDITEKEKRKEEIKRQLKIICGERSSMIGGQFRWKKSVRPGNINYSAIPQLEGVDLEKYRKKPIESWRLF